MVESELRCVRVATYLEANMQAYQEWCHKAIHVRIVKIIILKF